MNINKDSNNKKNLQTDIEFPNKESEKDLDIELDTKSDYIKDEAQSIIKEDTKSKKDSKEVTGIEKKHSPKGIDIITENKDADGEEVLCTYYISLNPWVLMEYLNDSLIYPIAEMLELFPDRESQLANIKVEKVNYLSIFTKPTLVYDDEVIISIEIPETNIKSNKISKVLPISCIKEIIVSNQDEKERMENRIPNIDVIGSYNIIINEKIKTNTKKIKITKTNYKASKKVLNGINKYNRQMGALFFMKDIDIFSLDNEILVYPSHQYLLLLQCIYDENNINEYLSDFYQEPVLTESFKMIIGLKSKIYSSKKKNEISRIKVFLEFCDSNKTMHNNFIDLLDVQMREYLPDFDLDNFLIDFKKYKDLEISEEDLIDKYNLSSIHNLIISLCLHLERLGEISKLRNDKESLRNVLLSKKTKEYGQYLTTLIKLSLAGYYYGYAQIRPVENVALFNEESIELSSQDKTSFIKELKLKYNKVDYID